MCTTTYLSQHDLAVLTRLVASRAADPGPAAPAVRRLAALAEASAPLAQRGKAAARVGLGASVRYRVAGRSELDAVVIACPEDPQAMLERVPALAPLALGLLGHAEGCTVELELALGRRVAIEIVDVQPAHGFHTA
jgi:transcription elongation GreA/GreB family factor